MVTAWDSCCSRCRLRMALEWFLTGLLLVLVAAEVAPMVLVGWVGRLVLDLESGRRMGVSLALARAWIEFGWPCEYREVRSMGGREREVALLGG